VFIKLILCYYLILTYNGLTVCRTFELDQKERQAAIMDKILAEEEHMRRRKKQQPLLWTDPKREQAKVGNTLIFSFLFPLLDKMVSTFDNITTFHVAYTCKSDIEAGHYSYFHSAQKYLPLSTKMNLST